MAGQRECRIQKGHSPSHGQGRASPLKEGPGLLLPLRLLKADSLNGNLKCNTSYRRKTASRKMQQWRYHSIPEHVTDAKRPGGVLRGGRLEIGVTGNDMVGSEIDFTFQRLP